ncbi:22924_t:CDS:2, partial [Dentiscutata erythropus]
RSKLYRDIPPTEVLIKNVDYDIDNIGTTKEDNIKEIETKSDHEGKSDTGGVNHSDIKVDDELKVPSHIVDAAITVSKDGTTIIAETAHVIKVKSNFPEVNMPIENRLRHVGIGENPGMGDRIQAYVDHSQLKTRAGLVPKDIKSPNLYQDLNPDKP